MNFLECSGRGGVLTKNDWRANIRFCLPERIVGSTLACASWHSGREQESSIPHIDYSHRHYATGGTRER